MWLRNVGTQPANYRLRRRENQNKNFCRRMKVKLVPSYSGVL
jgi:hypothetical protein